MNRTHSRARLCIAALASLASLEGCSTGPVSYVCPHAQTRRDGGEVCVAVEDTLSSQGLRSVRAERERGVVEALGATNVLGDMKSRERWRISVRDGDVAVEMHPETQLGGARWERDTQVCDCYHYARERELLAAIRARLRAPRRG